MDVVDLAEVGQDAGQAPTTITDARERGLLHVEDDVRVEPEDLIVLDSLQDLLADAFQMEEVSIPNQLLVVLRDTPDVGDVVRVRIVEDLDLVGTPTLDLELTLFVIVLVDDLPRTTPPGLGAGRNELVVGELELEDPLLVDLTQGVQVSRAGAHQETLEGHQHAAEAVAVAHLVPQHVLQEGDHVNRVSQELLVLLLLIVTDVIPTDLNVGEEVGDYTFHRHAVGAEHREDIL